MTKILLFCLMLIPFFAFADVIQVVDDAGSKIELDEPAQRVISLAPHITELLYAVGGEGKIIAAVDYSDYPPAANQLPRVGSGYQLDLESIISFKPDLIIGWKSGNNSAQLKKLKDLGFNLYLSEPKTVQGIVKNLRDLGKLLGDMALAEKQSRVLLEGFSELKKANLHNKKIKVFYQVWDKPLFTINGNHLVSEVIKLCGGVNVFSELSILSPQVDIEAVISRNPQVIVAGLGANREHWLNGWEKWRSIDAVKNQQLYGINADLIVRHTPRILQGAQQMCEHINKARKFY